MLKRISSLLVALAMVVTLIGVAPVQADAAVKILYGKKLNLTVGESDMIVVKGKGVTYKSSNKKIATVTKKGTVKAKKPGTCKITVKQKKSSKKVTVTVKPAKVKKVAATLASVNSAKVTWSKAKNVTGYYVYYSTKKSSGFKKVTVKGANKKSTTIKNLELGKTYYFKVKAYVKSGKKTLLGNAFSNVASVKTWKLTWNDEFEGTKLDLTKWNNDGATGGGGYGNKELQDYQLDYSKVENGNFVIMPQIQWNTKTNKYVPGSAYSTKIWTRNQHSFKYGKIEFRVKLPKAEGTWAAAWMLGEKYDWPVCGEIDILETTSQLSKTRIPQSLHMQRFNGMSTSSGNIHYDTTVTTATSEYHTYGIIWTEDTITFTIDGKTTGVYDPNVYKATGTGGTDDISIWPYNNNFYLILNCAIGGTLGGNPGTQFWTEIARNGDIVTLQDYFYIDWVRVYQ